MPDAGGFNAKMAFRKDRGLYGAGPAIAYPEVPGATDMAATDQVPFTSENLAINPERQSDTSLIGTSNQPPPDITRLQPVGGASHVLRYRGLERLIFCAMGYEHPAESPFQLAVGAERHLFELDPILTDRPWDADELGAYSPPSANDRVIRRGQLGIFRGIEDFVYYSCFINSMTITGTPADGVMVSFDYISYDRVRGSYNHGSWTLPAGTSQRALFTDAEVKIGLRGGGEGALVDPLANKFEIKIDRGLATDDQDTESGTHIVIPATIARPRVTLKLERPRYTDRGGDDSTILTYFDLDLELAAKVVLTGPAIGATGENYRYGFFMSSIKNTSEAYDPNVSGPGTIPNSWSFEAFAPAGTDIFAAANYSAITLKKDSPIVVTCQNEDTSPYILET